MTTYIPGTAAQARARHQRHQVMWPGKVRIIPQDPETRKQQERIFALGDLCQW